MSPATTAGVPALTGRSAVFAGPQPVLVTAVPGVTLRPPRSGDIDAVVAACQDEASIRWTTVPHPYQVSDAEFFVEVHAAGRWARADGAVFAIADPDDRYVGSMELRITAADPEIADVGFLVAPGARGRGWCPAALQAMCAWGFDALGLVRIEWHAYVGNAASRRVAEKAGFAFEGTRRGAMTHRGERVDAWLAALLPTDLPRSGTAG